MEPWAGVHPLVKVDLLGIDVTIEMDDSHFFVAKMATDATHRGETDRVIATEDDREGAA